MQHTRKQEGTLWLLESMCGRYCVDASFMDTISLSLSLCFSFPHLLPKRFSLLSQPRMVQPPEVKGQTLKEKLVYWHNKTWQFIWCSITQCSNLPRVGLSISQIPREGEKQKLYKWEIYHQCYNAPSPLIFWVHMTWWLICFKYLA